MMGIVRKILERVGTEKPVYLSIDIDTLDPACMLSAAVLIPAAPLFLPFSTFEAGTAASIDADADTDDG